MALIFPLRVAVMLERDSVSMCNHPLELSGDQYLGEDLKDGHIFVTCSLTKYLNNAVATNIWAVWI